MQKPTPNTLPLFIVIVHTIGLCHLLFALSPALVYALVVIPTERGPPTGRYRPNLINIAEASMLS